MSDRLPSLVSDPNTEKKKKEKNKVQISYKLGFRGYEAKYAFDHVVVRFQRIWK